MLKNSRRALSLVLVLILLGAILTACQPAPTAKVMTAQEIQSQAFTNMQNLKTLTYVLEVGTTAQEDTITMTTNGLVELPDKSYFVLSQDGYTIQTLVISPTEAYARVTDEEAWQKVDLASMEQAGINTDFMGQHEKVWSLYENPVLVNEVSLDGTDCYHLTYTIDMTQYFSKILNESISEQIDQGSATAKGEMWVGKSDLLIHKNIIDITYSVQSVQIDSLSTMVFSKFNEPVNIPQP